MRTSSFRAFLLSLLLALIACGAPAPTGTQSPSGNVVAPSGAKGGSSTSEADKTLAADEGDGQGYGAEAAAAAPGQAGPEGGVVARGAGGPAAPPRGAFGDGADSAPKGRMGVVGGAMTGPAMMVGWSAQDPVPVTAADPSLGKKTALVTIVEFSDFQCPFCQRAAVTVTELRKLYGDRLRVVWKNNPLPFHAEARPAAESAMALFESGGDAPFWAFHDRVFGGSGALDRATFEDALSKSSVAQKDVERVRQRGVAGKKVDADLALGRSIGVTGTPAFFINGVSLTGAQSIDRFREIVDAEIAKAKEMLAAGVAPDALYAKAAAKNFVPPVARAASTAPSAPPPDDKTVNLVPVGKSPVRGKATALVTMIVFSDFQCPFCARVAPTVEQVLAKYGDKVRLVWKNNPLPFHPRAEPAAQLALEARAQKGDAGFWRAHDLLFANNTKLSAPELEALATSAGLNAKAVMGAIAKHKYKAEITADQDLADDVSANGTPHFFINGRRLVGSQPLEKFTSLIDEELAKAEALVANGTPAARVYDAIQKDAVPPPPPPKKAVPAPGKDSPSKGPANAKVVVQVFSDFQCPFCKRAMPTMEELYAAFPGKIRIVWRNMPLPMHPQAALAAEAAMEARAQKGDAGFWKMHDLLFVDQTEAGLGREALLKHAATVGLDPGKFAAALDSGAHTAAVESDKKVATAAGITGAPGFMINDYFVSGAQPITKFRKLVIRALAEAK